MTIDITSARTRAAIAATIARVPACPPRSIQIVALAGVDAFIGWVPVAEVDDMMASVERRFRLDAASRTDETLQASLRAHVAERLAARDGEAFTDHLAALCLWLTLNHWSAGGVLRDCVDRQMLADDRCVVTIGIADTPWAAPGTAWVTMVGRTVHDARERLLGQEPGRVVVETREGHAG